MEESSRRAAAAAASQLPLPPRLPLDEDEPWWVLPNEGGAGFTVLGGAPAAATPLCAMLRRITSTSVLPLPHADAALAIRQLETEREQSVAACQDLLESGGGELALTKVARASPSLAAAAAATAAAAAAAATTTTSRLPPDVSLFEASPLASAWLESFLRAPVTLQWAEAASRLASEGVVSSSASSSRPPPSLTDTNLLPPASFTRAVVSRALQVAQQQQQQLEQQQQQQQFSPSGPTAFGVSAGTEPATESDAFTSIRLAVALVRSLLRASPRTRDHLNDPASRMELEAFCLASARSKDATDLYRDLKSGAVFR